MMRRERQIRTFHFPDFRRVEPNIRGQRGGKAVVGQWLGNDVRIEGFAQGDEQFVGETRA